MLPIHAVTRSRQGFTLVELAIVLVVIGLLTGGVLVGQNMIRQAQVNSVMPLIDKYVAAITAFKDKYQALPGDMANATSYWGANTGAGNDCTNYYLSTSPTPTSTCNGNGDGNIAGVSGSMGVEEISVWRHLQNAGLIEGSYLGIGGVSYPNIFPKYRIDGAALVLTHNLVLWGPGGGAWVYPWSNANVHVFGVSSPSQGETYFPILESKEALAIDTKFDDGKPGLGSIKTPKAGAGSGWGATCATSSNPAVAVYATTLSGLICSLFVEKIL